jgi:serine O-acetyltransferase
MNLRGTTREALRDYLADQINHFFPDHVRDVREVIGRDLDEALDRFGPCANAARMWTPEEFYYLHSEQNTVFLYLLANTIWRNRANENICTKLFYLNKALNGFSCFYDTVLPDIFFVGHSPGIVLMRTTYANYFAVYQNCTVGQSNGKAPVMEEGVLMYPGSAILGCSRIRRGTVVAQGASVIDHDTPGNCIAFSDGPNLVFKTPKRNLLQDIFRI